MEVEIFKLASSYSLCGFHACLVIKLAELSMTRIMRLKEIRPDHGLKIRFIELGKIHNSV